jgi:hypothetical protein
MRFILTSYLSLNYGVQSKRDNVLYCEMRVTAMIVKKNTHFRFDWLSDLRTDVYWEVWTVTESKAMSSIAWRLWLHGCM